MGTATAELAVALPALVLVLAASLAALDLGVDQVRCVDAARSAARLVARGDPEARAVEEARRAGPPGAVVTVSVVGARVTVEVVGPVPTLLGALGLGAPRATATARLEVAP
ncbi:TadE family type IV pilus minor pilin [Oryzobacter terrae]|uniref:TadE family type IV pilus minor pilin n=1 Tax=Oryzobacter terrae TaxID=1620385 RepID=UPI00366FD681